MKTPEKRKKILDEISDELVSELKRIFINRYDTYYVQWERLDEKIRKKVWTFIRNKNFPPFNITDDLIKKHLYGKKTIGSLPLSKETKNAKVLCIDIEKFDENNEKVIKEFRDILKNEYNLNPIIEFSGGMDGEFRRFHLWVSFNITSGEKIRIFGEYIESIVRKNLKLDPLIPIEINPKKVNPKKPFGFQVKVPLGYHNKSGLWMKILDTETLEPLNLIRTLKFLKTIQPVDLPEISDTSVKLSDEILENDIEGSSENENLVSDDIQNKNAEEALKDAEKLTIDEKTFREKYLIRMGFCRIYVYYKGTEGIEIIPFFRNVVWDALKLNFPHELIHKYIKRVFKSKYSFDKTQKKIEDIMGKQNTERTEAYKKWIKSKDPNKPKKFKDTIQITSCDKMQKNCKSVVHKICPIHNIKKEIGRRLAEGEDPNKIIEDMNIINLKSMWKEINEKGVKHNEYLDIETNPLNEIVESFGRNTTQCKKFWIDNDLIFHDGNKTTSLKKVKRTVIRVTRFNIKKVESLIRLKN